jgi:hypothetical protein
LNFVVVKPSRNAPASVTNGEAVRRQAPSGESRVTGPAVDEFIIPTHSGPMTVRSNLPFGVIHPSLGATDDVEVLRHVGAST